MRPPSIDPAELRPRRRWYWIAGAIVVVCCVLGGVGLTVGIKSTLHQLPRHRAYFTAGDTVRSTLTTDETWAVYADAGTATRPYDMRCTVTGPDGTGVRTRTSSFTSTFTENGRLWDSMITFQVPRGARYTVRCDPGGGPAADLMLGTTFDLGGFIGGIAGGLAALYGLPAAGLFIGAIIATIVAARRSSHRKRLLFQRYGPPPPYGLPPGPPSWPPRPPGR